MISKIELLVELKISDTTAITAFHTLERLGYKNLKKIRRLDYYKFTVEGDVEKFSNEIVKVDILVNANKHKYFLQKNFLSQKENFFGDALVLVKNDASETCLLSTLQNRLGFKQIRNVEKGVLWALSFDLKDKKTADKLAREIAQKLLANENYQAVEILWL